MASSSAPLSSTTRPLPLRMRQDLQAHPLRYGARRYWGIKDPLSLRFFQLRDEEYFLLRQLDGQASFEDIQRRFERRFAPRRMTVSQLQVFFGSLHRDGLVVASTAGQGEELLDRARKRRRRELLSASANVLAIRFRGVDPDRFLNRLYPFCRPLFHTASLAALALLVVAALTLVAVNFDAVTARLPDFGVFFGAGNALWVLLALAVVKVLHEMGHAFACKHFGGECHELGLMLLVFTPCLYCNVSDAWMMPSKWRRAAIGAAGMGVELVLAAVCTFLWWFSEPGVLNALCLNIMFVTSVSTLVFNGNPLLRFDGYYILSDLLEVPNLHQQSGALLRQALARWMLGIDLENDRMLPERRRGGLAAFAVAALLYRWVVVLGILWFCHSVLKPYGLEVLAQALAVMVVGGLVGAPIFRMVRFLRDPLRSRHVNWIRFAVFGGGLAALLAGVCLYPLPYRVAAPAVMQAEGARRVFVSVSGTLTQTVEPGQQVRRGEVLAQLKDHGVAREVEKLNGEHRRQQRHVENLQVRQVRDPEAGRQLPAAREALADLERRLSQRRDDAARLTLTAPVAGAVLPPPSRRGPLPPGEMAVWSGTPLETRNVGAYLETGDLFCLIGDPRRLEAVLVVDQADIEFVRQGQRVRLRIDELPQDILSGSITRIAQVDLKVAPRELAAEGRLPTRTDRGGVPRPASTSYQVHVALDDHPHALLIGAAGEARIESHPQTLAARLMRYLSRTFRFEL